MPENFYAVRNTAASEISNFVKNQITESIADEMYRNRGQESEDQSTNGNLKKVAKKREHNHEIGPKKGPRFFSQSGYQKRMGKRFMLKINVARIFILVSFMIAIVFYKKSIKKYHKVLQTEAAC